VRFRLFPRDFEGVGSYRVLYPYGFMEARGGHEATCDIGGHRGNTTFVQFPDPEKDEADADAFVFQCRWETVTPSVIDWIKSQGKMVVFEIDDLYHNLPPSAPANKFFKDKKALAAMTEGIRKADVVTVSTPALAEFYRPFNPNVHVLPNYLRWSDWRNVTPSFEKERPIRVGWMGNLKFRGDDLAVLRGLIGPWLERHQNVFFAQVGDVEPVVHDYLGIPEDRRLTYKGQIFPKHAGPTSMLDIGLVPLALNAFNECKSYLKGLEYAACGTPCIATPTQQYREWVEDGVNGFLAKKPKDWIRALDLLVSDEELRRQMGRNAFEKAQQHTHESGRWKEWEQVLCGSTLAVAA